MVLTGVVAFFDACNFILVAIITSMGFLSEQVSGMDVQFLP